MKRWMKLVAVLAGYALALLVSFVVVAIYDRRFTPEENQTMGGMIAGGEMMFGIAVFLLVALAPTGLRLWFLQRHRTSWSMFTIAGLAFAVAGLGAVLTTFVLRGAPPRAPLFVLWDVFSIAQMLGSPLFIASYGLFAWLAPQRDLRQRMLVAGGIEVAIAGCGLVYFLASRPPI